MEFGMNSRQISNGTWLGCRFLYCVKHLRVFANGNKLSFLCSQSENKKEISVDWLAHAKLDRIGAMPWYPKKKSVIYSVSCIPNREGYKYKAHICSFTCKFYYNFFFKTRIFLQDRYRESWSITWACVC